MVHGGRTDSRRGVCADAGLASRPNRGQSPTAGSGVWHYRGWGKFWEGNAPRALLLTRGVCISAQSRAGSRRREGSRRKKSGGRMKSGSWPATRKPALMEPFPGTRPTASGSGRRCSSSSRPRPSRGRELLRPHRAARSIPGPRRASATDARATERPVRRPRPRARLDAQPGEVGDRFNQQHTVLSQSKL